MKFKKLDARGFSHDILMVVFVVVFAISGVAYLVASHADSCDTPASGPTADTSPSGPVLSCPTGPTAGTCNLSYVPSNPTYQQAIRPAVTLHNTGGQVFNAAFTATLQLINSSGAVASTTSTTGTFANLQAGNSTTASFNLPYTTPYSTSSSSAVRGKYVVTSTSPAFTCSVSFTLPINPDFIVIEGEDMTSSTTKNVLSDLSASNKQFMAMYRPSTLSASFTTVRSPDKLSIQARGTQCLGVPTMLVTLDGKSLPRATITATNWTSYPFPVTTPTNANQKHTVNITYANDFSNATCDRGLSIDNVIVNEKPKF